jgi:alkyl sulfatase BDS1-like metallo-beta-lactamase superfamily hydrolase
MGPGKESSSADATLILTRTTLDEINTGQLTWQDAIKSGKLQVQGDASKFSDLLGMLDTKYDPRFNIVTP